MKRIKNLILENKLLSGSLIMTTASLLGNFESYLYHFVMARMLSPAGYGALASLIAILYLLAIPSTALITVVTKFTTVYKTKKDNAALYTLLRSFSEKILIVGILVMILFMFGGNSIAHFLQVSDTVAVILVGTVFLLFLLTTINNGILQGLLNFNFLAVNSIFSATLKLSFGFFLVSFGFEIGGAILAIIIATIISYAISFYPLRFLWHQKSEKIALDWKEIFTYGGPVTLAALGFTSLYSTDIILVKHFFPSFEAGLYGALSIISKIIFFASSAIAIVMFPLISEKFENGSKYKTVLYQAIALVTASSFGLTIIYFLWPQLVMRLLGSSYLAGASYLGVFAIFISTYSLSNLLMQFLLAIRETKSCFLPFGAAILQIILIWLFHEDFFQIIYSSITATSLLFISLLVYYFRNQSVNSLPAESSYEEKI